MTEKEQRVKFQECEFRAQELKVREAKMELDHGYKRLQAQFEIDYAKLKHALEREQLELESRKSYLELAQSELARGFEQ